MSQSATLSLCSSGFAFHQLPTTDYFAPRQINSRHTLEKIIFLQMCVLIHRTDFFLSLQNTELQCHIKAKPVQWAAEGRSGRTTLHLPPQVVILTLAFNLPLDSWFSFLGEIVFSSFTYSAKWFNHKISYMTLQLKHEQKINMTSIFSHFPFYCNITFL